MRELTAEQREVSFRFAHVLLPDYVVDCEPWEWHGDAWRRLFTVKEWQIGAILVTVSGEQTHQGDLTVWLYIGGEDQFAQMEHRLVTQALKDAEQLLESLVE